MKTIDDLRTWQDEAIRLGIAAKYNLIQAPGGSGKSLVQCALAALDRQMTGNRQLIVVPQNHIHHGFCDEEAIIFPWEGKEIKWKVDHNLCAKRSPDTVGRLKDFLLHAPPGATAISTHWALVSAWAKLSPEQRKAAMKQTTYRIDEAHHISNVFHEDDLELYNEKDRALIIEDATRLGAIARYILKANDPTTKLHLTTATFFRGDRKTILSKIFKQDFVHYYLPWDEYYETLGIERLEFDFVTYQENPIDLVLKAIAREVVEHHLIILPAVTCKYRSHDTLPELMQGLNQFYKQDEVLDLVTPRTQKANKELLFCHPDKFNAVVACRLFDEGTDWVCCNRLHNTDAGEASLTLAVQRFFRPLRRHPAKKHVRIDNYIPAFTPEMELNEQRAVLSDRFNATLACIITQGELMPTLVRLKPAIDGGSRQNVRLQDLYGESYLPLLESMLKQFELSPNKEDPKAMENIVETVIGEYGVPESVEKEEVTVALLGQLVRMATPKRKSSNRQTIEVKGIDAQEIREKGFDKIWQKQAIAGGVLCWGADNINAETVRELLGVVKKIPSIVEIRTAIQQFHARTGRRLTHSQWVEELGISAHYLDYVCRKRHGTSLNEQVKNVLGDPNENLLERAKELLLACAAKGKRLTQESGPIPKLNMTGKALNARLVRQHGISLAQLADEVLGVRRKPISLHDLRCIVRKYLKTGVRLDKASGFISEFGVPASNMSKLVMDDLKLSLSEIVDEVASKLKYGPQMDKIPSLEEIRTAIKQHNRKYQERPTRRTPQRLCGRTFAGLDGVCRMYYSTTLSKQVGMVLGKVKNWDKLLEKARRVIRKYRRQGTRLVKTSGFLQEMGCTALSLDSQLRYHFRTSLPREVKNIWGS